ncbi:hypothetical protein ACI79C_13570 [Geodermatophilus sp. SYSU D00697]
MTSTRRGTARQPVAARIARSVAVLAALAGSVTVGSSEDRRDPFPRWVVGAVDTPR